MSGKPLDPSEREAVIDGGQVGGAYLETIGKFDLRELTPDQWSEFCGKIFQETCASLRRRAEDEIPF